MGIIAFILFIIILIYFASKWKTSDINNISKNDELMRKSIIESNPKGKKIINKGAKELLKILNYKIDYQRAENLFVKSFYVCHSENLRKDSDIELFKKHLNTNELNLFDETTIVSFYNFIINFNNTQDANVLINLIKILYFLSVGNNITGTDQDEFPDCYGEFGLESSNPIPVASILDSYTYLDSLQTQNGNQISYVRIGSFSSDNIKELIDGYNIFSNGNMIATIYICPYNKKTSKKTPKGFKFK